MTFEDLESWQQARQLTLGMTCVMPPLSALLSSLSLFR